jgi:hypothetical protein
MDMKFALLRCTLGRIALLGLGLVTLPACGEIEIRDEKTPPVETDDNCKGALRVRIITDDTGPFPAIAQPYTYGVYDYLRSLNDSGGLRGCRIDVDIKDAHYDVIATQAAIDDWRKQPEWPEVSSVFVLGTGPVVFVAPELMAEKKVIIAGAYNGMLATPVEFSEDVHFPEVNADGDKIDTSERKVSDGFPYVFFPATDYSTAIRIGMQVVSKVNAGRIAMLHGASNTCNYCVDPLAAGKSYIATLPNMLLGEDLIVPQTSNPADEASIIQAVNGYVQREIDKVKVDPSYKPVNWFWSGNVLLASSLIAKAVAQAQTLIDQAFTDPKQRWQLRVMANNWGIDETTSATCGAACNNIVYGLFPVPSYGDVQNAGGMLDLMSTHDTYRQKDGQPLDAYRDVRYVQGYAAALMWHKAVELALATGHTSPTGEDLKNALESFREVDLKGMTASPVSFSAKDHRPQSAEGVYLINEKGALTFIDRYSINLDPTWLGY